MIGRLRDFLFAGIFLFLLLALQGALLFNWSTKDTRPLSWDESVHMINALENKDRMASGHYTSLLEKPAMFCYPPLYHVMLAFSSGWVSDISDAGAPVNFFFLAVLVLCVFFLAYDLLGFWPSLAASVLVSCYPAIVELTRPPMIDLALAASVALAMLCLMKSDHFRKIGWSLGFGIVLGLGLLLKWVAWIYVLGPMLVGVFFAFRNKTLSGFFIAMAAGFIIAFPWYGANLISVWSMFAKMSALQPPGGMMLSKWLSVFWYPIAFPQITGIVLMLLFLPALIFTCWRPRFIHLTLWIFVSLGVVFLIADNHNIRYAMPVLPALAILSVAWIPSQSKTPFLIVSGVSLACYLGGIFYQGMPISLNVGKVTYPVLINDKPQAVDWKHREIIKRIEQIRSKNVPFSRVVVVSNAQFFHSTSMNVTAQSMGVQDFSFKGPSKNRWLDFTDFILLKTKEWGPEFTLGNVKPAAELVMNPPDWFKKAYREVGRWPLPDGSEAVLYQADPVALKQAESGIVNLSLKEFRLPGILMENFSLRAVALSPKETAVGIFKEVTLGCSRFIYKGIPFDNVSFKFIKPHMNLPRFMETGEIQFFSLEALRPHVVLSSAMIIDYAAQKAKWLKEPNIQFEGERIFVSGKAAGRPIEINLAIRVNGNVLSTHLESARIAGIPLPTFFLRGVMDREVPLTPNPELPFYLEIGAIDGKGESLEVGKP